MAVTRGARSGVRRAPVARPVSEEAVAALLLRSHAYLLDGLRNATAWRRDAAFAREMIDEGFVVGVTDAAGAIGYAPLDAFDMRLVDRVRSLFVADFLTRPEDFASFSVCDHCGGATFDGAVSHGAACDGRGAVVLRRRAPRSFTVTRGTQLPEEADVPGTLVGIGA